MFKVLNVDFINYVLCMLMSAIGSWCNYMVPVYIGDGLLDVRQDI